MIIIVQQAGATSPSSDATYRSIGASIYGTLRATHTTNIPTANLTPVLEVATTTPAAKSVDIDYYFYKITGLTR